MLRVCHGVQIEVWPAPLGNLDAARSSGVALKSGVAFAKIRRRASRLFTEQLHQQCCFSEIVFESTPELITALRICRGWCHWDPELVQIAAQLVPFVLEVLGDLRQKDPAIVREP